VIHRCDVSTAQYFLRRPEPVMYVAYDARGEIAYWLWMQPYLCGLDETRPGWHHQKTVQIRIPCANRLTRESISAIADYVRSRQAHVTPAIGQEHAASPQADRRLFQRPPRLPKEKDNARFAPDTDVSLRDYALTLLECLLPSQFDEVIFVYNMPSVHLPTNASQVQKAISVIDYAVQQEGEGVPELLNAIYSVAPHLKENSDGSSDSTS
jgi:hypothetical protein